MGAVVFGPASDKDQVALVDFIPPEVPDFALPLSGQDKQSYKITEQAAVLPNMSKEQPKFIIVQDAVARNTGGQVIKPNR